MRVLTRISLASALLLLTATSAHAIPILRLTTSSGSTEVADGSGLDLNPVAGAVTFANPIDSWIVNVTTGLSKPVLGSAGAPELDLNSVNLSSGGAGWLEIELTDTGFTAQTAAQFLSAFGGTTNGSVSFRTFFDASNIEFGQATELTSFSAPGPAFSNVASSYLTSATPYSLTLLVRITHAGGTQVSSFDGTIKIPEPGTLLLLGAGCLGLAVMRRRGSLRPVRAA
jgi:hypothetical protein